MNKIDKVNKLKQRILEARIHLEGVGLKNSIAQEIFLGELPETWWADKKSMDEAREQISSWCKEALSLSANDTKAFFALVRIAKMNVSVVRNSENAENLKILQGTRKSLREHMIAAPNVRTIKFNGKDIKISKWMQVANVRYGTWMSPVVESPDEYSPAGSYEWSGDKEVWTDISNTEMRECAEKTFAADKEAEEKLNEADDQIREIRASLNNAEGEQFRLAFAGSIWEEQVRPLCAIDYVLDLV